jgi:hypothetical protein
MKSNSRHPGQTAMSDRPIEGPAGVVGDDPGQVDIRAEFARIGLTHVEGGGGEGNAQTVHDRNGAPRWPYRGDPGQLIMVVLTSSQTA